MTRASGQSRRRSKHAGAGNEHHEAFVHERAPLPADRSVGFVLASGLTLVGLLPLVGGRSPRTWALALAAALLGLALVRPAWLRPVNHAWVAFGAIANRVVTSVLMTLMFCAIVTPLAWLRRRLGHDPLRLALDPVAETYWIERQPPGPSPDTMKNQF